MNYIHDINSAVLKLLPYNALEMLQGKRHNNQATVPRSE